MREENECTEKGLESKQSNTSVKSDHVPDCLLPIMNHFGFC